jgi:hypothetical protein
LIVSKLPVWFGYPETIPFFQAYGNS